MRFLCLVFLLTFPAISFAALDLDETIYRNKKLGIKLTIPENWIPSVQTGYSSILLLLLAKNGEATISLSSDTISSGKTLKEWVEANATGITAVGMRVLGIQQGLPGKRIIWQVSAARNDKNQHVHQLYWADGARAFILTLCCPTGLMANYSREAEQLLNSIEYHPPVQ